METTKLIKVLDEVIRNPSRKPVLVWNNQNYFKRDMQYRKNMTKEDLLEMLNRVDMFLKTGELKWK